MTIKTIFFTGFPGFIGTKIVEKLITEDQDIKIYALVHVSMMEKALKIIKQNEIFGNKIEILQGDITYPDFGLDPKTLLKLNENITNIFHLAAIYDLEVPKKIAWKVNVTGTKNMINFALKCSNLRIFIYFSSIVAAGIVKGDVYEDELDLKCKLHFNYYEQTKFAAEYLIRKYLAELPIIIIRPGTVVGDSVTGETDKFDGFYYSFKFIRLLKKFPIKIPDTRFYVPIVPIDYVVNASCHLSDRNDCIGKCFHLGEFDLTVNDFLSYISRRDINESKLIIPKRLVEFFLNLPIFRYIFNIKLIKTIMKKGISFPAELMGAMDSYSFCKYRTDNSRFLIQEGIIVPKFKNYIEPILKYYEAKTKPKK
jgi:thioester reductase-like protein